MKVKLVLLLFLFIYVRLWAENVNFYNIGNQFYKDAQYDSASYYYEKAIEQDGHHPDIYYNLGNAYFKMRKLGKAIVNYHRALILAPRNKEIKYNLAFSRAFLRDDIKSVRTGLAYKVYAAIIGFFSFREIICIILFLSAVLTFFLILWIFYGKKFFRYGFISSGVLLLAFIVLFLIKRFDKWENDLSVVIVPEFQVRSGPSELNELLFTIHEGTVAIVLEKRDEWVRIKIEDGKEGWGKADGIEKVLQD